MIDAVHHRTREKDKYLGSLVRRQVETRRLLAVNMTDLTASTGVNELISHLHVANPGAEITAVKHGQITAGRFLLLPDAIPGVQPVPTDHARTSGVKRSHWKPRRLVKIDELSSCLQQFTAGVHRVKG